MWEIQPAAGNDANGGLFDPSVASPGTDFTLLSPVAYTDLAVDATTDTIVTSAAHPFNSTHVGNTIQITGGAGWTTGFYSVRSVSGVQATLDRSPAATSTTGGTGNLGGALASPGKAASAWVGGQWGYLKGTYSATSTTINIAGGLFAPAVAGTAARLCRLIGYGVTRGDNVQAVVTHTSLSTITLLNTSAQNGWSYENLDVDGATATSIRGVNLGSFSRISRCRVRRCTNNGVVGSSITSFLSRTEITGCTTAAFSGQGSLWECEVWGNTASGVAVTSTSILVRCLIHSNTGASSDGINASASLCVIEACTIVGNGRHGYNCSAAGTLFLQRLFGCILYGNGGWGVNVSAAQGTVSMTNCALGANVSGAYDPTLFNSDFITGTVTLTADPFVDRANKNFALNATAGGGAACRAAGAVGAFPQGLTTSYTDLGAAQHQDSGGGGVSRARIIGGV